MTGPGNNDLAIRFKEDITSKYVQNLKMVRVINGTIEVGRWEKGSFNKCMEHLIPNVLCI